MAVNRLPDGTLAVFDYHGVTTILNSDGRHVRQLNLPFSRLDGASTLDDNAVLVRGIAFDETIDMPLLHVVDLSEADIRLSFFPLPRTIDQGMAMSMAYAAADVRGDTVIAAFAAIDSVFVYTLDGRRQRAFRIPVDNFRVIAGGPPVTTDPMRRQAYHSSFETVGGIWWVGEDLIALSYKTQIPGGIDWHWAVLTTAGDLVYQERSTSRLLTADPERSVLVAISPESEVPNRWREITVGRGR